MPLLQLEETFIKDLPGDKFNGRSTVPADAFNALTLNGIEAGHTTSDGELRQLAVATMEWALNLSRRSMEREFDAQRYPDFDASLSHAKLSESRVVLMDFRELLLCGVQYGLLLMQAIKDFPESREDAEIFNGFVEETEQWFREFDLIFPAMFIAGYPVLLDEGLCEDLGVEFNESKLWLLRAITVSNYPNGKIVNAMLHRSDGAIQVVNLYTWRASWIKALHSMMMPFAFTQLLDSMSPTAFIRAHNKKARRRESKRLARAGCRSAPVEFYTVSTNKLRAAKPPAAVTVASVPMSAEGRKISYRYDRIAHCQIRARRGSLPLSDSERLRLEAPRKKSGRGYQIFESASSVPETLRAELSRRGIELPAPGDWLAVLVSPVAAAVVGDERLPYVRSSRRAKL